MWDKIYLNKQNIITETDKAVLIKMPSKSNYPDYQFWCSKKLIKIEGGKGYHLSISFNDSFKFKLQKMGKGTYNKQEILDEKVLTSNELKKQFNNDLELSVEQENAANKKINNSYLIIEEPLKVDKEINIIEELINE